MRGFIGNSLRRIGLVFQNLFLARLRSRSTDILKAVGLQLLAEIGAAYLALGLGVEIALVVRGALMRDTLGRRVQFSGNVVVIKERFFVQQRLRPGLGSAIIRFRRAPMVATGIHGLPGRITSGRLVGATARLRGNTIARRGLSARSQGLVRFRRALRVQIAHAFSCGMARRRLRSAVFCRIPRVAFNPRRAAARRSSRRCAFTRPDFVCIIRVAHAGSSPQSSAISWAISRPISSAISAA